MRLFKPSLEQKSKDDAADLTHGKCGEEQTEAVEEQEDGRSVVTRHVLEEEASR